jgi:hypothetical protein
VDWTNGKAVVGDDMSEILKMVEKKTPCGQLSISAATTAGVGVSVRGDS